MSIRNDTIKNRFNFDEMDQIASLDETVDIANVVDMGSQNRSNNDILIREKLFAEENTDLNESDEIKIDNGD